MSRRPRRPQRRTFFVGCEGLSEVGYVTLLQVLAEEAGLPVHLDPQNLAPAGDPLDRVERAATLISQHQKKRVDYAASFILLDADQNSMSPDRIRRAIAMAAQLRIRLVWQDTCHEAFLLRHLPGRASHRPPDNQSALLALRKGWPEYAKPMARVQLTQRLDRLAVLRAAEVEPGLADLLKAIGFISAAC